MVATRVIFATRASSSTFMLRTSRDYTPAILHERSSR